MGARQSKRSVDITTTPKKGEGEVAVSEEKIEKLGDADVKAVVTNGTAAHADIEFADKDETAKEVTEGAEVKENGLQESEGEKTQPGGGEKDAVVPSLAADAGDQPEKSNEETVTAAPVAESEKTAVENGEKTTETPETKKQKEKKKRKWSLRSISFSKKDKSKTNKDKEKNGDVEEEKAESEVTSPTEPTKTDETKTSTEEQTTSPSPPMTNGDASKEDLEKVTTETPTVETKSPIEEKNEPTVPKTEEAQTPAKEETTTPPSVEETKNEVRSFEETPPPPPSPPTKIEKSQTPVNEIPLPSPELQTTKSMEPIENESKVSVETAVITEKSDESIDETIKTDNEDSLISTPSIPSMIAEEKITIVSSAGDMMPIDENSQLEPETESIDEKIKEPMIVESLVANNVDSLPDLSTESLPSLPEPADSLLEPMSLPPLDSVPEPLVDESQSQVEMSKVEENGTSSPILTNGNATSNGLKSSPVDDEETSPPPPLPTSSPTLDGPLKQVICPEPIVDVMNNDDNQCVDVPVMNSDTSVVVSSE